MVCPAKAFRGSGDTGPWSDVPWCGTGGGRTFPWSSERNFPLSSYDYRTPARDPSILEAPCMARTVTTTETVTDDLDGSKADESITFTYQGVTWA